MPAVSNKMSEIHHRMNLPSVRAGYITTLDLPSLGKKCIVHDGLKPLYGRARKFPSADSSVRQRGLSTVQHEIMISSSDAP